MTLAAEVVDEVLLEIETGVIGAEVEAHGGQCSSPRPQGGTAIYSPAMTRRLGLGLLTLAVVVPLLAGCGDKASSGPSGSPPSSDSAFQPTQSDFREIRHLLARRATAVLQHHQQAFLATLDQRQPSLIRAQRALYSNLAQLPLASLAYTMDTSSLTLPAPIGDGDPVLHPAVVEQLQVRGTMTAPVSNALDETFVRRDGHWVIGAEGDADPGTSGQTAYERPWHGGPIAVRSDGSLTIVVDRARAGTLASLSQEIVADLDFDASVLKIPASHAVFVDATSNGPATSFAKGHQEAGAVTFELRHTNAGGDRLAGAAGVAIKINPHEAARLAGSTPLLRHELTHVMLHEYLKSSPPWLSEGVANWVEYYPDDYAHSRLSADLYTRVMAADRELPSVGGFGYNPGVNYMISQAAVAWLISHYGMDKLLELMRGYRDDYHDLNTDEFTPRLLREVYGLTERQVVAGAFGLLGTLQN
jgi:hypothetical protein